MGEDERLNRKEVQKLVDAEFEKYVSEVFEALKKAGYPQLEAPSFAFEIVNSLKSACVTQVSYSDSSGINRTATRVKQTYIQKFNEFVGKEKTTSHVDKNGLVYHAGEAYQCTLTRCLGVDFGISVHTLPGCYGRSSKKEKF
jgi:hypothetical protein